MELNSTLVPNVTIGLDLGDKFSCVCELDAGAVVPRRDKIPTTPAGIEAYFGIRDPFRVVLEVGTHSPWVSRLLAQLGHEVIVANPSAVYGNRRRTKRNDAMDAEFLARQGRADLSRGTPPTADQGRRARDLARVRAVDRGSETLHQESPGRTLLRDGPALGREQRIATAAADHENGGQARSPAPGQRRAVHSWPLRAGL